MVLEAQLCTEKCFWSVLIRGQPPHPPPRLWPVIWAAAVAAMGVGSTPERGSCLCREIKGLVSIHKHSCILHEEDIVREASQI